MQRVADGLFISAQPRLADFVALAAAGYAGVISSRPAGESADQPDPADERRAAEAAGLAFHFVPVTTASITRADVEAFRRAVAASAGPVLAHCRSGIRSANLHAIGEVLDGRLAADTLPALGAEWRIDLSIAGRWLERDRTAQPRVTGFFDPHSFSIQYVVADPATKRCALIDPILDFDETSGRVSTGSADLLLAHVAAEGLTVEWILDTHAHADHLSAAHYLHERTGAPTAIGARIVEVQRLWSRIYNWPDWRADGSQWDRLFVPGELFSVGAIPVRVVASPGHTAASATYVVGDAAFVHDTFLMPDSGTARADFPGGDARQLWRSLQDILRLPDTTRLFVGHDYQPGGRSPRWESTVGEQKAGNAHVGDGVTEDAFAASREARDRTLPLPRLMLHALQVNIAGGRLPEPENNGARYLKVPIDATTMPAWRSSDPN